MQSTVTELDFDAAQGGDYPEGLYVDDHPASSVRTLADVGVAEIQWFRDEGYLVVEEVFDHEQVQATMDALVAVLDDPRGASIQYASWAAGQLGELSLDERFAAVRKFMEFDGLEPAIDAMSHDGGLLDVIHRLTRTEDVTMVQDMALLKPPGRGREKPWHQDNAFMNMEPDSSAPIVGVWIALDEATAENGCMHVIPGSHREGPVVHFQRRDFQICDTDVSVTRDVVVPLKPGGALFFDGLIHHGTPANKTNTSRRAVQFHYAPTSATKITTERRLEIFGSEGKDATC